MEPSDEDVVIAEGRVPSVYESAVEGDSESSSELSSSPDSDSDEEIEEVKPPKKKQRTVTTVTRNLSIRDESGESIATATISSSKSQERRPKHTPVVEEQRKRKKKENAVQKGKKRLRSSRVDAQTLTPKYFVGKYPNEFLSDTESSTCLDDHLFIILINFYI